MEGELLSPARQLGSLDFWLVFPQNFDAEEHGTFSVGNTWVLLAPCCNSTGVPMWWEENTSFLMRAWLIELFLMELTLLHEIIV